MSFSKAIVAAILLFMSMLDASRGMEPQIEQCMNKTTFVNNCKTHLGDDPNSDNVSSQTEFVSFLNSLAANYSITNVTGPTSFDTAPITFQLPFTYYVCKELNKLLNTTNYTSSTTVSGCEQLLIDNASIISKLNQSESNFGLVLADGDTVDEEKDESSLCGDLYIPSIEAGYIYPCVASETSIAVSGETTTSVLPKTGIIVAAAGAALVTVSVFSGLAYRHIYGKGKEDADVQVDDAVEGI